MRVREILAEVAHIAENKDMKDKILLKQEGSIEEVAEKLEVLLSCYNSVMKSIALNYDEIVKTAIVYGKNANVNAVADVFLKLVSVTDLDGNPISYEVIGNQIFVNEERFEYTYRCIPLEQGIDDIAICTRRVISEHAYICGTLAEYFLRQNRIEEAQNWENRFRQAVEVKTDFKKRNLKAGKKWGL